MRTVSYRYGVPVLVPDHAVRAAMTGHHLDLWWIPVGAGGHVVVHTSRWWESLRALRARRRPRPLFHAALEVTNGPAEYVVEMTRAWGQPLGPRGVVAQGPVGFTWSGASPFLRYEIRCWRDGIIPDREWAVGPPHRFPLAAEDVGALIGRIPEAPQLTWGRDVFGIGDMWNSNSLISWLLQSAGIDAAALAPPERGDAPGWRSGIVAARSPERSGSTGEQGTAGRP
ncbi:hypothetical protein I2485_13105 [Nesterenkonia sp. E16_7]|uniref:hypothetical protein n=1 Tax=unclassified Nesterenkonia TaxID=2629769 RepID=UPI001A919474|nr:MULTISPECIES: hypothetical protein [unclassified Nesterenkonia]MBO0595821.1 hypothetical protein [Nesterenkonia sp. E16_10]MBO0599580.1 hypothetical protein [Nesterenkonia sp. E16_7]